MSRRNNIAHSLQIVAYSLILLACPAFANAEEAMPKEPIVVNGDKVEYFHEKKKVIGNGNISITYKDVVLTCEKITVYLDTREAIAEGNVKVSQKDAYFTGEKMNYNFDTRKGSVMNGYLNARPFYGKAQEVDKIAYKDQYSLDRGYITTCDLEKPHYRVQSRRVEIYLDDKVVARHILFFIGDVPVLYFPYYVQSLKDRKTHITIIPGQNKDWGYYVLTAYRYIVNDNNRGDVLLDYRTKKGLGEGINHYYQTDQIGEGAAKFYYTHENDNLAYTRTGDMKARYRWQVRHRWDMGENTDTLAILEFNKLSDRDVIKDYFYNEFEELGDTPDNYISIVTQKQDYSTELLLRKRFDKFYTVVERLPEYTIDIPNYNLVKNVPIYYKATASGVYLNKTFDNTKTDPGVKDVNVVRFDAYNQLSYATKIFRSLSVTPYAGVRETFYSRNAYGDTNEIRTIFNAGVDNSIKFYKIYDVENNFLGLDIHKLRHIITPMANYYYVHQPTISPDNLNQFDSIDALEADNGIKLSLENKLQTKRPHGGDLKSVDLATFIVSTDYAFRLKENNLAYKSQKFKSVDFQLELVPYSWLYAVSKMTVNTKNSSIETESIDLVANGGEKWALGIGHRYENVETGRTNLLTFDAIYKINDKWKVRAYERFNIDKGIEEQEYTIYRDLHCWVAELTYNIKTNPSDMGLWLVFKLKAFPEYPLGFRRTYSRPQFGSVGQPTPATTRGDLFGG